MNVVCNANVMLAKAEEGGGDGFEIWRTDGFEMKGEERKRRNEKKHLPYARPEDPFPNSQIAIQIGHLSLFG